MASMLEASWSGFVDWSLILSLIFGGCCSNAWALEVAASQNRNVGTLITLAQFLAVAVIGLPSRLCIKGGDSEQASPVAGEKRRQQLPFSFALVFRDPRLLSSVRFKPLAIPVSRWMIQVVLFLLTSLLNNLVFKYRVQMPVHIIFRSAGLVTNMLLGRVWSGKRYTRFQVLSVLMVTAGVALTTISTRPGHQAAASSLDSSDTAAYIVGIGILSGALFLSSAMGLEQDRTYAKYGRGHWEEGLFYLHFLALPMFLPLIQDIREQLQVVNSSPTIDLLSLPSTFGLAPRVQMDGAGAGLWVPVFWIPLILNVTTQILCVSGVHRLTAKVSSLTVTLVTAVRKAVSLVLSVVVIGGGRGNTNLWLGSLLVMAGTMIYTWDGTRAAGMKPYRHLDAQARSREKQE